MVQGRTTFVSGHIDSFESKISLALIDVYVVRPWHILDIEFISFRRINRNSFLTTAWNRTYGPVLMRCDNIQVSRHVDSIIFVLRTSSAYRFKWTSTDQVAGSLTRHVTRSRLVVVDKINGMKVFVHSHFLLFDMYKLKLIFLLI